MFLSALTLCVCVVREKLGDMEYRVRKDLTACLYVSPLITLLRYVFFLSAKYSFRRSFVCSV